MNLLDNWDQAGLSYNDVWGYVDGSGNEYAILGSRSKIHFFEITASNTLSLIDEFTPGATSTWRDFKTYGNFAYACTEGNEGLLVYDLNNLPTSVSLAQQITSEFTRAHNIYIDEAEGKLYVVGSDTQNNGLIIYDVTTSPPTHLASVPLPGGGYVHDIYVRNDTAYASHGWNGFYIWDVSNPSSPNFLASYTGEPGYNHSSWVTPDGNTAFYAREVGTGLPMTALDISNYNDIEVISNFQFPLLAPNSTDNTPHNPFLVGDYLYTSYYEDGIEVFDVSDPANVTLAGYYDTYPSNTQYNGYNGCWGTYPFLPSGRVLGSDRVNGLFLLGTNFSAPPPLALNLVSQTNVSCNGGTNGMLQVATTNGTLPYSYTLNGGTPQSSGTFTNLSAGTYIIIVTDAANGVEDITVTITQPDPITPIITQQQNVTCNAGTDGFISASAVGGTVASNYFYSIDGVNFSPNNTFTNLPTGTYALTVRDDNNCETAFPFIISEPDPLQSFVSSQTEVDCFGNNTGVIAFNTVGGTPNYLYSLNQVNYQASNSFSNLLAGNYTLFTLDANDCISETPFAISEPALLGISVNQQTNVDCFGDTDGEVILNGQGGTGNYQYNIGGGNYQTSGTFNNLSTGSYDFNIKDANDCIASLNIMITSPPEIVAQISEIISVECFGENTGSVMLQLSGGAGNFNTTMNGNTATGSTVLFQNLAAGTYPILIEDGNACTTIESVVINQNPAIQLSLSNTQNITCNGNSNGLIEVNVVGGNGGYIYSINGTSNSSNNTFTNLTAGQYSISTMDDLGCEDMITVDIFEPSAIQINLISHTNESCSGANDGSAIFQANGGVGNFQYTLSGTTNSTGVFNNLSAGNYDVVVLDGNNCVENFSFLIDSANPITAQINAQTEVDCFGNNNASIQVAASGGNSNFTFNLGSQSNSTGFFQNLTAGNYTISITDGNNCQTTVNTTIAQPSEISPSVASSQLVNCFGENSGSFQIQASGGTGNYNFSMGNETNSTGLFENLAAGNYTISITDENNCFSLFATTVFQPNVITSAITASQNVLCFGENSGSLQVQASGGIGNLNFTLGNETNSTGVFENLNAGNYNIIITDDNNCQSTITANISQPDAITSAIAASQNVLCFGENNGSLQVQASGGIGNLNFTLGNETNSTGLFENLTTGNYNIIITDDNNCSSSASFEITQPTELAISTTTINLASCNGQEGSIQVAAQGGTLPYQFSNGNISNSTGLVENLTAGIYMINVTDGNNCTTSINVDIIEPNALNVDITQTQHPLCNGDNSGSFQLQAMGGTGIINYTLGNETNTTGVFENLNASTYNITITDDNNCISFVEIELTEPAILEIINNQTVHVNCFGENNGSINLGASGGNGTLTFSLGNETNTSGNFENLAANNYIISVEDENGCNTSIEINITEPTVLTSEISQTNLINCAGENNGMIQFEANGGTGNYQFSLNGQTNSTGLFENLTADDYLMNLTDGNGCTTSQNVTLTEPMEISVDVSNIQNVSCNGENSGTISVSTNGGIGQIEFSLGNETNTTGTFENLAAGIYNIIITDENNCQNSIEATVEEPDAINIEILETQNVLCAGGESGSLEINVTGGIGNYLYQINGGFNATNTFENLTAGTYEIQVTDANGCSNIISTVINEPQPLMVTSTQGQSVFCHGDSTGFLNLAASGGTGNIDFTLGNETNQTGIFENLPAGTYEVFLSDNNMCTFYIELEITEPAPINFVIENALSASCFGGNDGSISVLASGGNGNFTYTLGNETNSTGIFENLEAGTYNITFTDQNNCSSFTEVIISEPQAIVPNIEFTNSILCAGDSTGAIAATATGGNENFEYSLGNETNSTGIFENLDSGTYIISIVDQNNCSSTLEFEINEPQQISTSISQTQNILCAGESSGSFEISATGGTGAYTFIFNGNSNTTGIFENLNAGTFTVTIIDENDCQTTELITLTEPDSLTLSLENTQMAGCAGATTGSFEVQASGGMGNYTYSISNQTNSDGIFENLASGVYDCLVTDENNCTFFLPITINENNDIELNEFNNTNTACFGSENGNISISVTGGMGDFTFTLGSETNATGFFQNLPAGIYNITATDINDCSAIFSTQITEPDTLEMSTDEIINIPCFGENTGSVQLSANGGTGNFDFSMNGNSNSTGLFDNLLAGNYDATVTDENNCNNTIIFEITEAPELIFSITNLMNDAGNGNGSVTFAGTGGTPPYLFSLDGLDYQEGITFPVLTAGNYIGYLQDANGCIIESPFEIILETSISNPDLGILEMNVFPNPFSEKIILQMDLVFAQTIQLEMINISGQTIFQKTTNVESGQQNITLDVNDNISAGIYFLSVKNEDQTIGYFKIIKK